MVSAAQSTMLKVAFVLSVVRDIGWLGTDVSLILLVLVIVGSGIVMECAIIAKLSIC